MQLTWKMLLPPSPPPNDLRLLWVSQIQYNTKLLILKYSNSLGCHIAKTLFTENVEIHDAK